MAFFSACAYTLKYRKGSSDGDADFLNRPPQLATDLDHTVSNRLNSAHTVSIHLIETCGFSATEPFTPGIGLGGLIKPASSCSDPILPFPCTNNDSAYRHLGFSRDYSVIGARD